MRLGMYEATRLLRTRLIWYGRRRNAHASDAERWRLERHAYRRAARRAMDLNGIDRDYFYRADLDASAIAVDVGAHDGSVAQKLVDLYGCRVYAYEPDPGLYAQLEQRFADHPLVQPRPYGLGASDATMVMDQRGLGSTVFNSGTGRFPTVEVQIRDGAAVFDELDHERIDYLKLNIEGAEYDLLDRLIETGWTGRSRYLLIQFHEWIDGAHKRRRQIRRKLRTSHDEVWNHAWIYELWCAKDRPHPPPPSWTAEEMEEIRAALRARRLEAGSDGAVPTDA